MKKISIAGWLFISSVALLPACAQIPVPVTAGQPAVSSSSEDFNGIWDVRWEGVSFVFGRAVPMFGYLHIIDDADQPWARFNDEEVAVKIDGKSIRFSYIEGLRSETGSRLGQVTVTFSGELSGKTLSGQLSRIDGIISRKHIGMGRSMVTYTEGAAPGFSQILLDQTDMLPITFNNLSDKWTGTRVEKKSSVDLNGIWMPRPEMSNDWLQYFEEFLTDEARQRRSEWVPYDDPALRCASSGVVRISGWPLPFVIVQSDREIAFVHEGEGAVRRVRMDKREIPEDIISSALGYSIGRWEGETLHVLTESLTANLIGARGIEQRGGQTRITERHMITNDGRFLRTEMILEDPLTFTRPLRRITVWEKDMEAELLPYECDGYTFFKGLYEDGTTGDYFSKPPRY